jgi:hypothetical protein
MRYNSSIVKKLKKPTALKHRAHSVLFNADLPFQPKKQASRVVYKRQSKHRNMPVDH